MPARPMFFHRRYHRDMILVMAPLSLELRGAYTTILDLLYEEAGPISYDQHWLSNHLGVGKRKTRTLVDELCARGLIYISHGHISSRRVEEALVKQVESQAKKNRQADLKLLAQGRR